MFADRIRLAKAAGIEAVEFWSWSDKDLPAIESALAETGIELAMILCEPIVSLTDPADIWRSKEAIKHSSVAAKTLKASTIVAQAGQDTGAPRRDQHRALVDALKHGADLLEGTGVTLALEPLNNKVDHPGYYLTSTTEGLDIVDEVGRPEIKLVYDIYHSAMMGERIEDVLTGRLDRVAHVHLADMPGRGEPGSGSMDWQARLDWLDANGYRGFVGLEYRPTVDTLSSLKFRRQSDVI